MLLNEITPFAQANRNLLEEVKDLLVKVLEGPTHPTIEDEEFVAATKKLATVQRALDRFEVCGKDEWAMKERALEKARHCRLHHRHLDQ
jgi:hypothetical protein